MRRAHAATRLGDARRPSTADGESLASLQRRINESTPLLEVSDLKIVSKAYFGVRR